jgi:hypothetical protein
METTVFRSGISKGLIIFLIAVIGTVLILMLALKVWIGAIIDLGIIAFIVHLIATTYYTIKGTELKVRSGVAIFITIDISKITRIEPTNTMLSAPALSFDRLEVFYNKYDSVVISPKDKVGFIAKLKEVNPGIVVKE